MSFISVVIPVYNAEQTLRSLYEALTHVFAETAHKYEVLFVEDRSADRSWEIIGQLSAQDERVRGLRLSRNFGQHNAILCGIRAARGDVIVTLDDDLQNPPSEIPRLVAKLEEGFGVVYGTPEQEQHGVLRDFASRLTKLALKGAMGVETAASVSAFRAFRTNLRLAFEDFRGPFVSIDVLLTWGTSSFTSLTVQHAPRAAGTSNYTLFKLVTHAFDLLTGFSTLPLQLASYVGFASTIFGFCVLAYVVMVRLLLGSPVQGFTFLVAIIAVFAGAQLFAMGIFGEYLARMHFRSMDRPAYVIAESLDEEVRASDSRPS